MKLNARIALAALCLTSTAMASAKEDGELISSGDTWSYFAVEGTPPRNWTQGEGREGWKSGPTVIGWGEHDQATIFSDTDDASRRFPIAHFRTSIRISKADRKKAVRIILQCDDGCIAWVNGTEVGRVRMPKGNAAPYSAEVASMMRSDTLTVPPGLLKKSNNMFAVAVYQSSAESSDMRFNAVVKAE